MALQLQRAGVLKIRPLEGGFEEWMRLEMPVESVRAEPVGESVAVGDESENFREDSLESSASID